MAFTANDMEEKMNTDFSDVGADVGEVQKQLANLQVNTVLILCFTGQYQLA
jgi:hypothetical protein